MIILNFAKFGLKCNYILYNKGMLKMLNLIQYQHYGGIFKNFL